MNVGPRLEADVSAAQTKFRATSFAARAVLPAMPTFAKPKGCDESEDLDPPAVRGIVEREYPDQELRIP